jgi:hypothetical protein
MWCRHTSTSVPPDLSSHCSSCTDPCACQTPTCVQPAPVGDHCRPPETPCSHKHTVSFHGSSTITVTSKPARLLAVAEAEERAALSRGLDALARKEAAAEQLEGIKSLQVGRG